MSSSFLVFATLFCAANAATKTWTGIINDQQWSTGDNWSPSGVPGPADDVIINDKESKDATIVLAPPAQASVASLTVGAGSNNVRVRVLSGIVVKNTVTVGAKGVLELNSGDAALSCNNVSVAGELAFIAGNLLGNVEITGKANFGEQSAKVFNGATVKVTTTEDVIAAGSLQFKQGATVSAKGGVVASGKNTQFIVMDDSKGNSFVANGFSWVQ